MTDRRGTRRGAARYPIHPLRIDRETLLLPAPVRSVPLRRCAKLGSMSNSRKSISPARRPRPALGFHHHQSKGSVPCLRLDNGEYLTECAVLLQWIADQKPGSGLAPAAGTPERYRLMETLNFMGLPQS
ncbi:MAG: hypothetical protein IPH23_09190 [Gammaproteobacteria bacterium]|nr:hypothetical protein [Gammaproteobacteria bacterium]